ncbi:LytTR family transcriptional regulator [Pedobacter sp. N36a]|nr:LytTR family transcriptional regulator [Pedobacter sp. N36a]
MKLTTNLLLTSNHCSAVASLNSSLNELETLSETTDFLVFPLMVTASSVVVCALAFFKPMKIINFFIFNLFPLIVKHSLSALEAMLSHHSFLRIHRSFIVSLKRITAFTSNAVEIEGLELPIGRCLASQVKRLSLMGS